MSLGERIKEQRKNSGLSQEKVAEFVGVSRQAVTKWEANQSAPSTENLFKLAEIFGTTVDMLLSSNEDGKNSPAEQIYYLYKMEEEKKAAERRGKMKKNLLLTLATIGGYIRVRCQCPPGCQRPHHHPGSPQRPHWSCQRFGLPKSVQA